jgi:PAS domain-containing protein
MTILGFTGRVLPGRHPATRPRFPIGGIRGNWFSLRIRPYKNLENRIDGAVLSLFDINDTKRQEGEIREARDLAEAVVQTMRQPLIVLDGSLRVRMVKPGVLQDFQIAARKRGAVAR